METTQKPRRLWVLVIPVGIVLAFLGRGVWAGFDIAQNEARTRGVITGPGSHGSIRYAYSVGGSEYTSVGMYEDDRRPEVGSEVEVRYSTERPWISTLRDPLLFPKQVACGVAIVAGFALIVYLTRRSRRAESVAADRGAGSASRVSDAPR